MRRLVRFLAGVALGALGLAVYLYTVGVGAVLDRAAAVTATALVLVVLLVVLEGVADGIGVWASVRPLNGGLSVPQSVQFALAGDFFDILSPAGPVSSEPIMAQFVGATTETSYSEALGVRSVAKYVKSGAQLVLSALLGLAVLTGRADTRSLLYVLGGALLTVVAVGIGLVLFRTALSKGVVRAATPVVSRVSALYRDEPHDRAAVQDAVDRFRARVGEFRTRPGLLALVALGGLLEQLLTATALWVALDGTGQTAALLPIVVLVPLPQAASVVPIPASLGAYDLLLSGALAVVAGVAVVPATAAVLLVRTASIPFGVGVGGVCAAFMRGWRPGTGPTVDAD
ncbi:flippase-like domain-containing protein [Salinirubellus salinus]|uniref:Flippase-like domain-containing protein n=1 Tax=Salinirubellus salinus TaxID=1364945 RepID=A0A9E7U5Q3_9EURY|nr:flippase-like domain-containing protein [Salinirubellus salinus]UWM55650.1 flippase-like domain-containing protein [Salinirubellus salinus]